MTNPQGGVGYREVAARLREEIRAGRLRPGDRLPAEDEIPSIYGVAVETGRRAIRLLRQEGLVVVRHGHPTRVADPVVERELVRHPRGTVFTSRPPTAEERDTYGDSWMIEAVLFGTVRGVYPADRVSLTIL